MKQVAQQNRLPRWAGYLLIPHELLHLVGFWLVGKRCKYQWGQPYVTPIEPMSHWQRLIGRLFPFVVFFIIVIISGVMSGFAYGYVLRGGSLFWFIFWLGLAHVAGLYAGTAIGDLRKAYLLIFDKPWHSWTPFDIFFWPVVDWSEVRRDLAKERKDEVS